MKIFKFGGASVKNADAVKNVAKVIKKEADNNTLIVVSAMGKMTNAFEILVENHLNNDIKSIENQINTLKLFHKTIYDDLFGQNHSSFEDIEILFNKLNNFLSLNSSTNYNLVYDQIVPFGELISTKIISNYLNYIGIKNEWLDVRNYIKTDDTYRDAKVDWETTSEKINTINYDSLKITQGFLGRNENNTTTLGREGSDYTAGIFAYCLNAESVTIWKDVEGVLNADPRVFSNTKLLESMSYTEAIEMAFYGASVIHPKTIQPLMQKDIPLYVRSFIDTLKTGTCVKRSDGIKPHIPCYIVKKNQIYISISTKDFSFMMEDNISFVFKKIHEYKIKVNLIQNSAISFSVCLEDKFSNFDKLFKDLEQNFYLEIHKNVSLFTIRHFDETALKKIESKGNVIIKQINTDTAQLII